ncbi:MAG: DUF488 domain-containing protein [Terriglobia bacterium]
MGQSIPNRLGGLRTTKHIRTRGARRAVGLKRAYEQPSPSDGMRVLVDRLWPRGLSKVQLAVDFWLKDAAPSDALRRWYGHKPRRWESFAEKYRAELAQQINLLRLLDELRRRGRVTLLYAARDADRNNAVVLREVLDERHFAARHTQTDVTR